jgi:twitching motility protein PilT
VFPEHAKAQVRMQLSNTICCILCQKLLPHKSGEGRVLACEAMMANPAIRNLIREGKTHQVETFIGLASSNGSILMDNSLQNLVKEDKISVEVAERYVKNIELLHQKISHEEQIVEKGFFGKKK